MTIFNKSFIVSQLCQTGYTESEANLMFDVSVNACDKANETLMTACDTVPVKLHMQTMIVAASLMSALIMKETDNLVQFASDNGVRIERG